MKAWKAGAAVLLGVVALAGAVAGDDRKVYKAFHPHWWDVPPPYKCVNLNGGWAMCGAGVWDLPGQGQGLDLIGHVVAHETGDDEAIMFYTAFGSKPSSFSVECRSAAMAIEANGKVDGLPRAFVSYSYTAIPDEVTMDACLDRPLTLNVDGRKYRLGTKRLQRALEKVRDRL